MASIDYYKGLINKANAEITACGDLISEINSLGTNIESCASYLYKASNSVETGLITNGAPADRGRINEIASTLRTMVSNVSADENLIKKRISELEDNIVYYNNRIDQIIAEEEKRRAAEAFRKKDFGDKNKRVFK